jgi:hypothetical protein
LKAAFARAVPGGRVAKDLALVDPAEQTARGILRELGRRKLRRDPTSKKPPIVQAFYMTVADPAFPGLKLGADGGLEQSYKVGRTEGDPAREDTVPVLLNARNLPDSSRALVQALPKVWKAMLGTKPPN